MLKVIFKHLNFLISKNLENEKKFEARRQFESNLKALQESDDEIEVDKNENNEIQVPVVELTWSCSKFEGFKIFFLFSFAIN